MRKKINRVRRLTILPEDVQPYLKGLLVSSCPIARAVRRQWKRAVYVGYFKSGIPHIKDIKRGANYVTTDPLGAEIMLQYAIVDHGTYDPSSLNHLKSMLPVTIAFERV